jgi:hypothetical protein
MPSLAQELAELEAVDLSGLPESVGREVREKLGG